MLVVRWPSCSLIADVSRKVILLSFLVSMVKWMKGYLHLLLILFNTLQYLEEINLIIIILILTILILIIIKYKKLILN